MEDFVPTRVSQLKKNATANFVSVNYERPKKKPKTSDDKTLEEKKGDSQKLKRNLGKELDPRKQQELEMKKIRHEVIKFGIAGFQKTEAKRAKKALIASLGGEVKRKRKQNYKKVQEARKAKKIREKEQPKVSGPSKSFAKHKVQDKKRKRKSDGILGVYGKVERSGAEKNRR